MLPPRRQPVRSGIERAPQRIWQRHRKWVRTHECCVPACQHWPVEFAHVRSAANAGTGLKPPDWFGVSLCNDHHREQHSIGAETFSRQYQIDLWKLAEEFAKESPDIAMKEAMRG